MRRIPILLAGSALILFSPVVLAKAPVKTVAALRYLAIGDSFTIGTGSSPAEAFPARIAARMKERGRAVELKNLGVNGYTTQDVLDEELPVVRGFKPDVVTLAVGANDLVRGSSLEKYRSQLKRIFSELGKAGVSGAQLYVLPQPDWALSPVAAGFGSVKEIEAKIVEFNRVLHEEARAAGAHYVDLYSLMEKQARARMIAGDGLHPSARAHDEWAEAVIGDAEFGRGVFGK